MDCEHGYRVTQRAGRPVLVVCDACGARWPVEGRLPDLVGASEAAAILGVSHQALYHYRRLQPVVRIRGATLWDRADVESLAAERKAGAGWVRAGR